MRTSILRWIVSVLLPIVIVDLAHGQSAEERDTESLERAESQAEGTDKVDSLAAAKRIIELTNA